MKINVVIVDDEKKCIDTLKALLANHATVSILDTANSVESGLEVINRHSGKIDVVFLDVQMSDGDGFLLLKQLDRIDFSVVFTTAYDQYALSAIKFSALDYLLKPISHIELAEALHKYRLRKYYEVVNDFREKLKQGTAFEKLAIPTITDIQFIGLTNIIYLESDKNYTTLHMVTGQKIVSSKNLGYYDKILSMHGFFRVHNSYMVNLSRIRRFIKGKAAAIELDNGMQISVAGRRRDELMTYLNV